MYDDSDGAYNHLMPPILNDSKTIDDALIGTWLCGQHTPILGSYQGHEPGFRFRRQAWA
jgi:phospholipase C